MGVKGEVVLDHPKGGAGTGTVQVGFEGVSVGSGV